MTFDSPLLHLIPTAATTLLLLVVLLLPSSATTSSSASAGVMAVVAAPTTTRTALDVPDRRDHRAAAAAFVVVNNNPATRTTATTTRKGTAPGGHLSGAFAVAQPTAGDSPASGTIFREKKQRLQTIATTTVTNSIRRSHCSDPYSSRWSRKRMSSMRRSTMDDDVDVDVDVMGEEDDEGQPSPLSVMEEAKEELISLAKLTQRGFDTTRSQRVRARELIEIIAKYYDPTIRPARGYCRDGGGGGSGDGDGKEEEEEATLEGKWTLVYTDAPDITSLDTTGSLLPSASKLGRIGQECKPPYIKNVIEWKRPDWTKNFFLRAAGGGSKDEEEDDARVLQKVCCEAVVSSSGKPNVVDLTLVGLEVVGITDDNNSSSNNNDDGSSGAGSILLDGPASYFRRNPLELRGPLSAPFGQFTILYLDEKWRIIRTNSNYVTVSTRDTPDEEWF